KLTHRGSYPPQARALARKLERHGCSQEFVGIVIEDVCKAAGVRVNRRMSRRTVGRCIGEGGVAAKIQLAHEIMDAPSLTASSDGTSHRNIEYQGRHVTLRVPNYVDDSPPIPRVRLLGVDSDTDHSSETQVKVLVSALTEISDLFNRCPSLRQDEIKMSLNTFFSKLKAMHGDHAADGKKNHRIVGEIKKELGLLDLGARQILATAPEELKLVVEAANDAKIAEAGGQAAWDELSKEEQEQASSRTAAEIKTAFGLEVYEQMTDDEQRAFDMLLWGGCCMHKELNAAKGGSEGMKAWWKAHPDIQGPTLLANRDNAATLGDMTKINEETNSAQRRALNASEAGGVKTTLLAGALFNHANDKKGLQDTHVIYFQGIKPNGKSKRFPDTSTTRYGSNLDGAAELIVYLKAYITLLEQVRDKKEKGELNHLESNVYRALHDPATLTEFCAMIIYALTVSWPYSIRVRGPGTENVNLLDLGPLHHDLKAHIRRIIENPDIIFGNDLTPNPESCTLDGGPWHYPEAFAAVQKLAPSLPHLRDVAIAFFEGTLPVWERFTAEFDEGGMIDGLSDEEKLDVFMPTTNDANEGILGSIRWDKRTKVNASTHAFNARAMFRRNNTQAYMDANFGAEHHAYIMHEHRRMDASGRVQAKAEAIRSHNATVAKEKADKRKATKTKKDKAAQAAAAVTLITDKTYLAKLTKGELEEQLSGHRLL
ncbi:hypothetical protein B0H17DRAFT_869410, partial [Mycena rosella]